jgi:hypothetical protein
MDYNIPDHISGDTWDGIASITVESGGIPISLVGCSIKMQVRTSYSLASPVYIEFSTVDGTIIIPIPLQGIVSIPPRLVNIPVGDYKYDFQITYPNGFVKTYMKGNWKILQTITR